MGVKGEGEAGILKGRAYFSSAGRGESKEGMS